MFTNLSSEKLTTQCKLIRVEIFESKFFKTFNRVETRHFGKTFCRILKSEKSFQSHRVNDFRFFQCQPEAYKTTGNKNRFVA